MYSRSCILKTLGKSQDTVIIWMPNRLSDAIAKQFFPVMATQAPPLYVIMLCSQIEETLHKKLSRGVARGLDEQTLMEDCCGLLHQRSITSILRANAESLAAGVRLRI